MTSTSSVTASAEPTKDRPLNHFTAERMWINDPNGLIHHNGLYHLYFRAKPYGAEWGNMSCPPEGRLRQIHAKSLR